MSSNSQSAAEQLQFWLTKLIEKNGTDLHIKSGSAIRARIKGEIVSLSTEMFESEVIEQLARTLIGDSYADFEESKEFDTTYALNEEHRFRVNIYLHLNGFALVFRVIPKYIKSIETLNLPKALHQLTHLKRGLVLITGTTASGKSTTLSSIISNYPKLISNSFPYPRSTFST